MTQALLDGDILAWRSSASCEPTKKKLIREPLDEAIFRLDQWIYSILSETSTDGYRIFLSGTENFRYLIYPDYKANRRGLPRPEWLEPCREFLVREWKAEICIGYEADDGIGINHNEDAITCSIDKDFNQLPGQHYNIVTKTHYNLDSREAALAFWSSVLQGDRADNILGVGGMGPKKAHEALYQVSEEEMERVVRERYSDDRRFFTNVRLLSLLRSEEEYRNVIEEINQGKFS